LCGAQHFRSITNVHKLRKNIRAAGDKKFVKLLDRFQQRMLTRDDMAELEKRFDKNLNTDEQLRIKDAISLYSHRANVEKENQYVKQ